MVETTLPLAPELWATVPAPDPVALLVPWAALRLENAALPVENAALRERIRELEARLGLDSSNSSRPLSSGPAHVPAKRRGGQESPDRKAAAHTRVGEHMRYRSGACP
jgi:hypothetical protein